MSVIDFTRYALSTVTFSRECLGIDPDPWQQLIMNSPGKRMLLNCSRQSGKSTSSSIIALHRALFYPGSLILLVSPSLRQSGELFKKCQFFYRMLPDQPKLPEDNKLSMTLSNGSRIVSLPGTEGTIRGYSSVDLLIEDESSRVADSLYYSVRPMLAVSGGRIMLLSTPYGKRGHFFEAWNSNEDWQKIEIPATMCPRISPEFLEEEQKALGSWWYEQEYLCQFKETADSLFNYDTVIAAMSDDIAPLFPTPDIVEILPPGISDEIEPLFQVVGT